jgi:hypothetical protein
MVDCPDLFMVQGSILRLSAESRAYSSDLTLASNEWLQNRRTVAGRNKRERKARQKAAKSDHHVARRPAVR